MNSPRFLAASAALLALALAACPAPAQTTTYTWTGAGSDGNWSTATNWGGTAPASSLTITRINLAGTANTATIIDSAYGSTLQVLGLTFANSAGPFSVSSSGAVLEVGAEGIVNNSFNNQQVSAPLRLGANQSWYSQYQTIRTTFTGPVDLNGFDLTLGLVPSTGDGRGSVDLLGPVSGGGRLVVGSYATLRGANTYSGGTLVDSAGSSLEAILTVDSAANLGTGPVELQNRGRLVFEAAVESTLAGTLNVTGGMLNEWNSIYLDKAGTTLRLQPGGLQGSGVLVVEGQGTLKLTGANTFSGELYTGGGRLELTDTGGGASLAARQVWVGGGHFHVGPGASLVKAPGYYEPYFRVDGGASAHFEQSQTLTEVLLSDSTGNPILATAPGVSLTLLQGISGYSGTINATLAGSSGGDNFAFLVKNDSAGTLTVTGQSTFTGATLIQSGVLSTDSIKPAGQPSALGSSGTIWLNRTANLSSTLRYTGPTTTTDRRLVVSGIDGFHSFLEVTDPAATLTMTGLVYGSVNTSVPSLQKTGPGTLEIASTGNSFYVPPTSGLGLLGVRAGALRVTGSMEALVTVESGATASRKLVGSNPSNYRVQSGSGLTALTAKAGGTVRAGLGSSSDVLGADGVQFDAGSTFAVTVDGGANPTTSKIQLSGNGGPVSFSPVASTGRVTLQLEKGSGAEFVPGQLVTVEVARGGIYKKVSGAYNAFTYNADEWAVVTVGFDIVPGSFSLFTTEGGSVLNAQFTPVPEPGMVLAVGAAILAGLAARRRAGCGPVTP